MHNFLLSAGSSSSNKNPKGFNPEWLLYAAAAFIIGLLILGLFSSCNAEKKALAPYKAVVADIDTFYQSKKLDLGAKYCNDKFPVKPITIVKDSIVKRTVRVQDNAKVNELKNLLANCLGKKVNIDSIYNTLPFDTIFVDKWHIKESIVKDTVELYRKNEQLAEANKSIFNLQYNLEKCYDDLTERSNQLDEVLLNENKLGYSAKLFFGNLWDMIKWWLLALLLGYFGLKLLQRKYTLPFKLP